ncbi:hypothetical protein ENHY17A_110130 [Moraxellaceae bacterium 17A]|nr:hypothetical protein ENHY17A_110130 [Moraxellaceae bacterium 17A]
MIKAYKRQLNKAINDRATLNDYPQETHKLLLIQRLPSLTGYEKMVAATPYQSWYFVVRCDIMPHDK